MKALIVAALVLLAACAQTAPQGAGGVPTFTPDTSFPQPLAEKGGVQQIFGQVAGIAVDPRNGHIWAIHRPRTLLPDEAKEKRGEPVTHRCCTAMPTVV